MDDAIRNRYRSNTGAVNGATFLNMKADPELRQAVEDSDAAYGFLKLLILEKLKA